MNAKVAISFLGTSPDADLVIVSGRIIESMTGNAVYPTPFPALAAITTARNGYVAAVNALDGGSSSIALRNQERAALV